MTGQTIKRRKRMIALVAVVGVVVFVATIWRVWTNRTDHQSFDELLSADRRTVVLDEWSVAQIETFCGDCHALPRADSFPRDAWHDKVLRGFEFYAQSGRNDLQLPPIHWVVTYFRERAPERLVFPDPKEADTELSTRFTVEKLSPEQHPNAPKGIAYLRWTHLQPGNSPVLLACDMFRGSVSALDLRRGQKQPRVLARLDNPCHVEPCDLDGDGRTDLVVADLGSFPPLDHDRGRVVWLRPSSVAGAYEQIVLASGLGRVADVRPLDLHGDGDVDLIVAEFGMYRTGGILLLHNVRARVDRHASTGTFSTGGRVQFMYRFTT